MYLQKLGSYNIHVCMIMHYSYIKALTTLSHVSTKYAHGARRQKG